MSSTFINIEVTKEPEKLAPICNQDTNDLGRFILICNEQLSIIERRE